MTRSQRGQVMAFIAVALAMVLMPVAAYAVDSATVSAAAATLQEATALAAMEAAEQLNASEFRSTGRLTLDVNAAREIARAVLGAEAPAASLSSVAVQGADVTVSAAELVHLPFDFFPTRVARLDATASARLQPGFDNPSSFLPLPTSTF